MEQRRQRREESSSHCIDHLCWSNSKSTFKHASNLLSPLNRDSPPFSFLLAKDHGLDHKTGVIINDLCDRKEVTLFWNFFECFTSRQLVNPNPLEFQHQPPPADEQSILRVIRCRELWNGYEKDVGIQGFSTSEKRGKFE